MNKVSRLGMLFNEGNVPDFGSIQMKSNDTNIYYLLAQDIPKLNGMLTKAAAISYLIENETLDICNGAMAFIVDYKTAGTSKIYAYHRGRDHWYEFNIRSDLGIFDLMWSRHPRILRETKTISGTPPLTFKSNGRPLKNYRIYGNTLNGESVGNPVTEGEHTGEYCVPVTVEGNNLFDFRKWSINVAVNNGNDIIKNIDGVTLIANTNDTFTAPYAYTHTDLYKINVKSNTTYVLSWSADNNLSGRVFVFKNGVVDGAHMINADNSNKKYLLFDTDTDTEFVTLRLGVTNAGDSITYSKIMLVEGDAALPYEPYHEAVTTNIYLPAQIKIIGNETEYVDFKTQKQYFADGTSADVALPVLLTLSGTNNLTVETEVKPSNTVIKGRIKAVQRDGN